MKRSRLRAMRHAVQMSGDRLQAIGYRLQATLLATRLALQRPAMTTSPWTDLGLCL